MLAHTRTGISVQRFHPKLARSWDDFVATAKNALFMFSRGYMDYHADRFRDHSLMFFRDGALVGLLPANEHDGVLYSHAGLSFGGVISDSRMKTVHMLEAFDRLFDYIRIAGLSRLVYKAVPHIYHLLPADEDLYALFRAGSKLVAREVSSCITMKTRPMLGAGRKWSVSRLNREGIEIQESRDFIPFMNLARDQLRERHGKEITHTGAEMQLLADRFPENIRMFVAADAYGIVGGVIVYITPSVVHVQYMASNARGKAVRAVDGIINWLLTKRYPHVSYFDFGISTEERGTILNVGLAAFKEGFGARTLTFDTYAVDCR